MPIATIPKAVAIPVALLPRTYFSAPQINSIRVDVNLIPNTIMGGIPAHVTGD
jgi:hypothetical protein